MATYATYSGLVTQKNAVPTLKLFGLGPLLLDRYQEVMRELIEIKRLLAQKMAVGRVLVAVVYSLAFLVAAGWVAAGTLEGSIGVGSLPRPR